MKIKMTLAALAILLLNSCTTNYYLVTVDQPTAYYKDQSGYSEQFTIRPGRQLLARKSKKSSGYRAITFGDNSGFIKNRNFQNERKYSSNELKYLHFMPDSTYYYSKSYVPNYPPPATSASSYSNSSTNSGGTVHVNGYYRKDGTYVRPYTRSAPKKRS
jgi:hypothetical protein